MKAILNALLEVSVYASVIAIAILTFRLLFQKSISPKLQYLVWMLLLARLLLPVTVESGFHVESLFPKSIELPPPAPIAAPPAQPVLSAIPVENEAANATQPVEAAKPSAIPPSMEVTRVTRQIDLYAMAALVWVCGASAFALFLLVVKLRFFKRMKKARIETPPEAAALYEACRAMVDAGRRMELWVVDAPLSPGIAYFGGAVLLIPSSMLHTKEALRFALLHELAHQRRGDPIINALLNPLRVLYWFNPILHYAFSQLRADMEIACDHEVTRLLTQTEKKGYLTAILDLFSYETQPQLGMAQFRTRRMAQRRMEGAFMKRKSTFSTKVTAAALCLILIIGCFTTACKSAPPVSQKNDAIGLSASFENTLLGSATLQFSIEDPKGITATRLKEALALLNDGGGANIQPGEEWSFLDFFDTFYDAQASGAPNKELFLDGFYMSSAIHGAALNAGLDFTGYPRHSWMQTYPETAFDAAMIYSIYALKFKNSGDAPVTLSGVLEQGENGSYTLTVSVRGIPHAEGENCAIRGVAVATVPAGEMVYQDDPTLPVGTNIWKTLPRDGYIVATYRDTYKDGKLIKSELLHTYSYEPVIGFMLWGASPFELADGILSSDAIERIQHRLIELGHLSNVRGIYGIYDKETAAAVKLFQEQVGLSADGVVGEATLQALFPVAHVTKMLEYAVASIGKKYEFGMEGPSNFDGSGLVYYCLKMAGGDLRRLSTGQYAEESDWEKIAEMEQLKAGDLIFFYDTISGRVAHVGIVLDDTYMVDASSSEGEVVKREYKTDYWETRFAYGRRPW